MRGYERGIRAAAVGAVLAACFLYAAAGRAVAQVEIPPGWEIVTIGDGEEYFHGWPDINDRGDIVFERWGSFPDHSTREIFLYSRGELMQLTDDNIKDGIPRINNKQEIAWMRDVNDDDLWDIVLWRDGEFESISQAPEHEIGADLNAQGHVVWKRYENGSVERAQLFLYDGVSTRQITKNELSNQSARINERSQIVWTRYNFFDNPWTSAIMLYDADTDQTTQLSNDDWQLQEPGMNDIPQAVWASPQGGVELWDDGETIEVLKDGLQPAINNCGDISVARWDPGHQGYSMWLLRNGRLWQLTDGTQGGLRPSINARGEVAWWSGLFPDLGVALLTKPSFVADIDFDGDVDLRDYTILQGCAGRQDPLGLECTPSDLDRNDVVDHVDFVLWHEFLEGPRTGKETP